MIDKALEARINGTRRNLHGIGTTSWSEYQSTPTVAMYQEIPVVDEDKKLHIEAVKALIMNEVNVKDVKF